MANFDVRIRGYSRRQVDDLLERVEQSLAGSGELTADGLRRELAEVGFGVVLRGYDRHQVHAAVQEWIQQLERC